MCSSATTATNNTAVNGKSAASNGPVRDEVKMLNATASPDAGGDQGPMFSPSSKSASLQFLAKVKLFKRLPKDQQGLLQRICVPMDCPAGQVLFKQGDEGNDFYVIVSGSVEVSVNDNVVANLGAGDYFGELALLRAEPRTASIKAVTKLSLLQITREKFQQSGLLDKLEFSKRKAVGGGAEAPLVTKPPSTKTADDKKAINNALKTNTNIVAMMGELDSDKCQALCDIAWEEKVEKGKALISQGSDEADYFYIVKQGSFEVLIAKTDEGRSGEGTLQSEHSASEGEAVGTIPKGSSFGELALMYFAPRAATVKALDSAIVWVIDRANFKNIIAKSGDAAAEEVAKSLETAEFLKEFKLSAEEKLTIASAMTEQELAKGDCLYEQKEDGSSFFLLTDGEVSVLIDSREKERVKGTKDKALVFGSSSFTTGAKRTETVMVKSDTAKAFFLDKSDFELLVEPMEDLKKRGAGGAAAKKKGKQAKASAILSKAAAANKKATATAGGAEATERGPPILLKDLKKLGLLGCGGFGAVELVQHKGANTYALKSLSKGHVVKCRMQDSVMAEKTIQYMCDSAFVVKLYECYNDPQCLLFLLELALGGELYDTYCKKGFHGSLPHALYYVAGTTFAFEHMHERKICYRDLKPENLLLTDEGKVKITDMGLAKVVIGKTHTTCGTPDYFAPEVIAGTGHNHAVDWYTLGILAFEFMVGNPPFETNNPQKTMGLIQKGITTVKFPAVLKTGGEDFVKKLCGKDPSKRLGFKKGGMTNVQKHIWFKGFDWDTMLDGSMEPPYKPVVKSKTDLKNFSANVADKPPQIPYKDDGSGWDKEFATQA